MPYKAIREKFRDVLPWESEHVSWWTDSGNRGILIKFQDGSSGIFVLFDQGDWYLKTSDGVYVRYRSRVEC